MYFSRSRGPATAAAAAAASALLLPLLASAQVDFDTPPTCVSGIQVITSAGTFQTGYGTLDTLTQSVVGLVPDSASVALAYPANESPYTASVASGIHNLTAYVQYFVDGCPDVKLVLLGYSQGMQVSLSTVCGWPDGLFGFANATALEQRYQDRILAVAGYGDPTHLYPTNFDRGTSTHDGEFVRPRGQCVASAFKIASWCDHGDTFCDNCKTVGTGAANPRGCDPAVHTSYWYHYNPDVVSFVQSRVSLGASAAAISSTTSSMSSTSTAAAQESSTSSTSSTITTTVVSTISSGSMTTTQTSTITSTSVGPAPTSGGKRLRPPPIFRLARSMF